MEEVVLYIIVCNVFLIYGERGNYVPPLPIDLHIRDKLPR